LASTSYWDGSCQGRVRCGPPLHAGADRNGERSELDVIVAAIAEKLIAFLVLVA
jgi:hypothetical protein